MKKLQVLVELDNEQYLGEYDIETLTSAQQSSKIVKNIINDIIDEFENEKLTIKIYDEVVFKNGKSKNTTILFTTGEKYQKLVNLYNTIL